MRLAHALDEIRPTGLPERIRLATVEPGTIALWHLGGAGYAVRTNRAVVIVDPFFGPSAPPDWVRGVAPPFAPDEIAVEVLQLCDGVRNVDQIVGVLAEKYTADRAIIGADVIAMLKDLAEKGFLAEAQDSKP